MEWLSTHPMSAGRAERLKAELAGLPKKSPMLLRSNGPKSVSRSRVMRLGVIADTHGLFDPAVGDPLLAGVAERR